MLKELETRIGNLEKHGIPGFRDFVATSALVAIGYRNKPWTTDSVPNEIAQWCYDVADAFVQEKGRRHAPTK